MSREALAVLRRSRLVALALVFSLALVVRAVSAARVAIIERDGVEYLEAAARFARGDARAGLEHHYPPAYPILVAALARATGGEPGERPGQAVSALAGALLAMTVALGGERAFGRRAGVLAGLVAAVHPACVEQSAQALPDALMAALVVASVVAAAGALSGKTALFPLAGALAAASYLARPEGIVALAALLAVVFLHGRKTGKGAARRARDALLLLSPAILVALPYVVAIKKDAGLNGGEAGEWKLTKKRELFLEAGGERVFPRRADGSRALDPFEALSVLGETAVRAAKIFLYLLKETNPVVLALVLLGLVARPRAPPARALLACSLAALVSLGAACALFRADERYARTLAVFLLPLAGAGLARLVSWCEKNLQRRRARALLAAVLLTQLAFSTRALNTRKATWRMAGELCASLDLARIASLDPRVAFYAGSGHVDLHGPLSKAGPSPLERAAAAIQAARDGKAGAIVVRGDAPLPGGKDPLCAALLEKLPKGALAHTVERDGAESVVVFTLQR